jgi:integrase
MASISKQPNGHRTIQFVAGDGRRRSIRLGKMSQRDAEGVKVKIEALNAAHVSKIPFDNDLARWVAEIGDDLAGRLAAVGLIPERQAAVLDAFLAGYIGKRTDVKPRTQINLESTRRRLVEFFGRNRALKTITPADADAFSIWLKERYASTTQGRTIRRAQQYFRHAVRGRLIQTNPFQDVKAPSQVNESRKVFITLDMAQKVLDACPDAEWRLIVALCRFAGLRCPSELLPLKWSDIDWATNRFRVTSPKTAHHEGGGERFVPIFAELRPHLEAAFEAAEAGTVYLINRYRDGNANLRTQMHRVIRKAGLVPWTRTFSNLRASRETELAATFPLHVVCTWIGNSAAVAQKHYLQTTEADFQRASGAAESGAVSGAVVAQKPVKTGHKGGAESGAVALHIPVQSALVGGCQRSSENEKSPDFQGIVQILTPVVNRWQTDLVLPAGLEPAIASTSGRCRRRWATGVLLLMR